EIFRAAQIRELTGPEWRYNDGASVSKRLGGPMRRSGMTRLVHRLGVAVLILELAHVPLPLPAYAPPSPGDRSVGSGTDRDRTACDLESCLQWRWAPIEPTADADDEEAALALADDGPCGCQLSSDKYFASAP